jgi:hypothetical protein
MRQRNNACWVRLWRGLLVGVGVVALCALGCAKEPRTAPKGTIVKIVDERVQTPPPTLFEVNRRLPPRHRVLKAEGKPGESHIIWCVYYRNGKEVRRVKVREDVIEPPQPRIYEIGVHGHIASRGTVGRSAAFRTVKVLEMHASAYTPTSQRRRHRHRTHCHRATCRLRTGRRRPACDSAGHSVIYRGLRDGNRRRHRARNPWAQDRPVLCHAPAGVAVRQAQSARAYPTRRARCPTAQTT